MGDRKVQWGMVLEDMMPNQWSFGVSLSHDLYETYVYFNFYKWSLAIGKMMK